MRREEVRPLLLQAVDDLEDPDLADTAWAAGLAVRRRRRRAVLIGVLAVIVVLVVASIVVGATN
ncbi:hypothetical protein [Kribbella sp. HUAS MG21]|uniref:DUF3040 family protein n=1 Tax=Kribbella sp. HUAS MG21 TaxID=3160966 RepID=A0AAU7T4Q1_9ACTN